ncbi:unnamed protein product [marine sediment metagenome]|uniref:Uncharacterized protein n=1 Tax=marine sediment metagenome TaxID=412755 RepID=X1DT97_9ZZZZ
MENSIIPSALGGYIRRMWVVMGYCKSGYRKQLHWNGGISMYIWAYYDNGIAFSRETILYVFRYS